MLAPSFCTLIAIVGALRSELSMRTAGGSDVEVPVLSDKKLVVNRTRATFAKRWLWIVPGIVENGLKPQMAKLGAATQLHFLVCVLL